MSANTKENWDDESCDEDETDFTTPDERSEYIETEISREDDPPADGMDEDDDWGEEYDPYDEDKDWGEVYDPYDKDKDRFGEDIRLRSDGCEYIPAEEEEPLEEDDEEDDDPLDDDFDQYDKKLGLYMALR